MGRSSMDAALGVIGREIIELGSLAPKITGSPFFAIAGAVKGRPYIVRNGVQKARGRELGYS